MSDGTPCASHALRALRFRIREGDFATIGYRWDVASKPGSNYPYKIV